MNIEIRKLTREELQGKGVFSWPVWEKEVSKFDWKYDSIEECYILEGEAVVHAGKGQMAKFGAGDFVIFPKGLSCTWEIKEPVRKHYNFR